MPLAAFPGSFRFHLGTQPAGEKACTSPSPVLTMRLFEGSSAASSLKVPKNSWCPVTIGAGMVAAGAAEAKKAELNKSARQKQKPCVFMGDVDGIWINYGIRAR